MAPLPLLRAPCHTSFMRPLPESFTRANDDVLDEVAQLRGTTMTERGRILEALCRLAAEQVAQHPDPARTLRWQDPVPPESEALLARLRARHVARG